MTSGSEQRLSKPNRMTPNTKELEKDAVPAQTSVPTLSDVSSYHLLHVYRFLTTPPQELQELLTEQKEFLGQSASGSYESPRRGARVP